MIFLRNLSQTPAQVKLLTTHGAVDFAGSILETTSGLSRINAAIVIAILLGVKTMTKGLVRMIQSWKNWSTSLKLRVTGNRMQI